MPKLPIKKEIIHILDNKNSFSLIYLASLFLLKLPIVSNPAASAYYSTAASSHNYDTTDVKHPWATLDYEGALNQAFETFGLSFRRR
jgi:hypothetical protein